VKDAVDRVEDGSGDDCILGIKFGCSYEVDGHGAVVEDEDGDEFERLRKEGEVASSIIIDEKMVGRANSKRVSIVIRDDHYNCYWNDQLILNKPTMPCRILLLRDGWYCG
jgi:hypothetical protein